MCNRLLICRVVDGTDCGWAVHCCLAGDEVTYDYRFASEQKLRCNCGAATCRGFVNAPSTGIDTPRRLACAAGMLLPRHEVEILRGTQAVAAAAAAAAFPAKKHLRF